MFPWPDTSTTWLDDIRHAAEDPAQRVRVLGELAARYRAPIVACIRQKWSGLNSHDVEDRASDFIHRRLLGPKSLFETFDPAHPSAGGSSRHTRLRTYLAAALQHFLTDCHRHDLSRQGSAPHLPLPDDLENTALPGSPLQNEAPPLQGTLGPRGVSLAFDRDWALHIFESAFRRLEGHYLRTPEDAAAYSVLRPYIMGEPADETQTQAAARLGLTREAFASRLHRLREDWRKALTAAITPTVATPADIEDELRYLSEVLRGG